jgi:hypothetical protein
LRLVLFDKFSKEFKSEYEIKFCLFEDLPEISLLFLKNCGDIVWLSLKDVYQFFVLIKIDFIFLDSFLRWAKIEVHPRIFWKKGKAKKFLLNFINNARQIEENARQINKGFGQLKKIVLLKEYE